ncbi:MAG TPA: tetraacyldisaccharide 4'-kinase [Candidatus Hydrogenedentes bacterium]|nr:tetraacyldisaccharide 4'-kinase [Candidatus Hydrogenedentota bacterium]
MSVFDSLADKIRRNEPVPAPLSLALNLATPVTRLGMAWRLRGPRTRVNARVISFGNITAGGTGKTPAVIERAQEELQAGHRVAVLTRGYGSGKVAEPFAVTPDTPRLNLADMIGDEPALIVRRAPDVIVVKAANRVAGAQKAIELGCDVLLMDDGFQHVALERDENVLLIDAANPFGNGRLIPRGILREPLTAMTRATQVILTRCDQAEEIESLEQHIHTIHPGVSIRKTRHAPCGVWRVAGGQTMPLDMLQGKEVSAVCGIGHPEAFFRTLESLGARIISRKAFSDHAVIPASAIPSEGMIITTEKDAMRLSHAGENLWALAVALEDLQ